jgi:Tol biopolymer transport system component
MRPADWSPDAQQLLCVLTARDKTNQLALVSPRDGSIRTLKSLAWRTPAGAAFSPDGRWIAYDLPPTPDRGATELFLLAADGGKEVRLTDDGLRKHVIGWAADGRGVFYETRQGEASAVSFLPVRDGRADGPPRLLRADIWGAVGFHARGTSLAFVVTHMREVISIATVDIANGRATGPPTRLRTGVDLRGPAVWSPEGDRIAFARTLETPGLHQSAIVIRELASTLEREIPIEEEYPLLRRWAPDGHSIELIARRRGRFGLYRLDLASGRSTLVEQIARQVEAPVASADDLTWYAIRSGEGGNQAVVARNRRNGEERELVPLTRLRSAMTLSPDGKTLAVIDGVDTQRVLFVPTAGGVSRVSHTVTPPSWVAVGAWNVSWTANSQFAIFRVHNAADGLDELWVAARDGTTRRLLASQDEQFGAPQPSADGRRVLYRGLMGQVGQELWVMENLPGSRRPANRTHEPSSRDRR